MEWSFLIDHSDWYLAREDRDMATVPESMFRVVDAPEVDAPEPEHARRMVDEHLEDNTDISIGLWEAGVAHLSKDLIIDYLWRVLRGGYSFDGNCFSSLERPINLTREMIDDRFWRQQQHVTTVPTVPWGQQLPTEHELGNRTESSSSV